ncbi:hypothetical protein [Janthinobacterium sp. EB271-G4-7A]|uniref:hypothetical protein n=1 Tax=Janthinobacterium sp. EB271-G4-7A TaxID=2775056 RepID=UPI001E4A0B3F|nr:hypothetical protein [Janthinobacterium sp. EB271-G4-7A]MCC7697082.1 hypothetical protein [Janthinobacterium sp. EB271-G4-7A]
MEKDVLRGSDILRYPDCSGRLHFSNLSQNTGEIMTCQNAAETILANNGISVTSKLRIIITFLCQTGASPEWIAQHCMRLVTLKDIIDSVKTSFPSLSCDQLDKLADMHMNGASLNEIFQEANAMVAPPTPPAAQTTTL